MGIEEYYSVIVRVDGTEPWCAPAFFVPKGDGISVRMVTDFTRINRCVIRPVHPFPLVQDIVKCIPAGWAFFAKMDAIHGYFQLVLDEELSRLTMLLLPSGRYRYLHLPMGLSSLSDKWCRHSDTVLEELPYARKIVDDSSHGIKPDPERIKGLTTFPAPWDISGVRSFLGLANQLSGFVPDFGHMTAKLRELTSMKNVFLWEKIIKCSSSKSSLCLPVT